MMSPLDKDQQGYQEYDAYNHGERVRLHHAGLQHPKSGTHRACGSGKTIHRAVDDRAVEQGHATRAHINKRLNDGFLVKLVPEIPALPQAIQPARGAAHLLIAGKIGRAPRLNSSHVAISYAVSC